MQSQPSPISRAGSKWIMAAAAAGLLLVGGLVFYFVDFFPSLSHLNVRLYSGATTGDYYAGAARSVQIAQSHQGKIENVSTSGSIDNLKRLEQEHVHGRFALVQNGMPWPPGLQLVGHLPTQETVFLLGRGADRLRSFSDLRGLRIGGGPVGSGTAYLSESIFGMPSMKSLSVKLSFHPSDEQLRLITEGKLDLGVFVISEKSEFIKRALLVEGLQIAGLRGLESVTMNLAHLQARTMHQGLYDPVRNIPPVDKPVLSVNTLLVTNQEARRSEIVGMLQVMSELHPNFINYNRTVINETALNLPAGALDFYNNQGAEIFDRYLPHLMDLIPISNLVQLVMGVSILFNLMGLANRFILWRIDANRIAIEEEIEQVFGSNVLPEEIEIMNPLPEHAKGEGLHRLNALIGHLTGLESKCRKQSQSILVPMGAEMAYRYQEKLISTNLIAIKKYKLKLER
jgi:TRAP-type uncharacterized transport system substrate-binding protein